MLLIHLINLNSWKKTMTDPRSFMKLTLLFIRYRVSQKKTPVTQNIPDPIRDNKGEIM